MLYINPKGKFILSAQEQRQELRYKVSSEGLSTEIDILIRHPIQVQTKAAVVSNFSVDFDKCVKHLGTFLADVNLSLEKKLI